MTVRRMKTYAGGQGYVYQYYFVGKRQTSSDGSSPPANEYVFDVTADRKTSFPVSIFLPQNALETWAESHGRTLTEAEQYAAVKMRLFQAFDEIENLSNSDHHFLIAAALLENLLAKLGVD